VSTGGSPGKKAAEIARSGAGFFRSSLSKVTRLEVAGFGTTSADPGRRKGTQRESPGFAAGLEIRGDFQGFTAKSGDSRQRRAIQTKVQGFRAMSRDSG
jgi:hypothetical protein